MLGIFKKCLISLSVIFGGFGVNSGSSVIDVSNSTNNLFRTQLKQANDSTSLAQVGDVIKVGDSYFKVIEVSTTLSSSNSSYTSSLSSSYLYAYWYSDFNPSSSQYFCSYFLDSANIKFTTTSSSLYSEKNHFEVYSSILDLLVYPSSIGFYSSPCLFSFKIAHKFSYDGYKGSYRFLLLDPYEFHEPNLVTDSISIIVSGLTEFGKGLGQGISDIVTAMMYTGTGVSKALSPFFVVVLVFAAIALCVSLTSLIFNWLRKLGVK